MHETDIKVHQLRRKKTTKNKKFPTNITQIPLIEVHNWTWNFSCDKKKSSRLDSHFRIYFHLAAFDARSHVENQPFERRQTKQRMKIRQHQILNHHKSVIINHESWLLQTSMNNCDVGPVITFSLFFFSGSFT